MDPKGLISTLEFQEKYFKNLPQDFYWQNTPLQVYSFGFIAKHIVTPLPLFQSASNYVLHLKTGGIKQLIETNYYDVKAPALFVVLKGTVQSLVSIESGTEGYIVLMEDITMQAMFNEADLLNLFVIEPVLKLSENESNWIHTINGFLHNEVTKELPNRKIAEGLLQALLYNILELSEKRNHLSRNQQIAIRFKQLVYNYYKTEKNIAFYSGTLHISENYLNRCVKTVFKKSSKEIISEVIVIQAQLLLWDFSKSIADISYELNILDTSYFSRIFKKITGQTPTEYRDSIMHNLS